MGNTVNLNLSILLIRTESEVEYKCNQSLFGVVYVNKSDQTCVSQYILQIIWVSIFI